MPRGGRHGNIPKSRSRAYEAIKRKFGGRKRPAARIAWEGRTKAGRKRMGRRAAKTRKRRGR